MRIPTAANPRFLLGAVELAVLWEDLSHRPPPAVLRLGSPGRTHDERERLEAASRHALCERGLADASGPDPRLVRLVTLLASPDRQLELRADGDPPVRAVAAGRDADGALGVRRGHGVELVGCDSLPGALISALPPARPGPGRAYSVPTTALVAALSTARSTARIDRQAQIVALRRDPTGELSRVGGVVRLLHGPRGRYLLIRAAGTDGVDWSTVVPADARRVRQRVSELLHASAIEEPPPACYGASCMARTSW